MTVNVSLRHFATRGFAAALAVAVILPVATASATPFFRQQTGKQCSFCHTAPITSAGNLNNNGEDFRNNNYQVVPVCRMQVMDLYDRNGTPRGNYNVEVCE